MTISNLSLEQQSLIENLINIFTDHNWKFEEDTKIIFSDEIPMAISDSNNGIDKNKLSDFKKSYDYLMGAYCPVGSNWDAQGEIILYKKVIKEISKSYINLFNNDLEETYFNLETLVLLHEIGHWIVHWMKDSGGNNWTKNYGYDAGIKGHTRIAAISYKDLSELLRGYSKIKENNIFLHEALAQTIAYWGIKGNIKQKQLFDDLCKDQPNAYSEFKKIVTFKEEKVIAAIEESRKQGYIDMDIFQDFCKGENRYSKRGKILSKGLGL